MRGQHIFEVETRNQLPLNQSHRADGIGRSYGPKSFRSPQSRRTAAASVADRGAPLSPSTLNEPAGDEHKLSAKLSGGGGRWGLNEWRCRGAKPFRCA